MLDAAAPAIPPKRDPNFSAALLVPIIGFIAVFVVSVINLGPITFEWNGASLIAPIQSDKHYRDGNELRFETNRLTDVRAAISGTISVTSERQIEIVNAPLTVKYAGLTSISAKDGQVVKRGEVIGSLTPAHSDGEPAGLSLRVCRFGSCLPPKTR